MPYPFPSLWQRCLLCGHCGCARWKGYFVRWFICGVIDFDGLIAIHVGHCRRLGCGFCYFPDFLIPGRRLSRLSHEKFIADFQRTKTIQESIDELVGGFVLSDFTMALSSAYNILYSTIRAVRISHERLMILAPEAMSVLVFYDLPRLVMKNLFSWIDCPWHSFHHMVFHPP